jgi:hypothetical protein
MASGDFSFAQFAGRIEKVERALHGPDMEKLLHAVGKGAKADAVQAVESDLGDRSMSHWRRGNPIEIGARYDMHGESAIDVGPERKNRGPWRVLEDGRQSGAATDLVQYGKARKDGTRRAMSRGRNQGHTSGKRTWSDAVALMEKATPKRVQDEHVKALRDALG